MHTSVNHFAPPAVLPPRARLWRHRCEPFSDQHPLPTFTPVLADHMDSSKVLSALPNVDEVYQAAVALFYLEDYSYKDIAEILEVPVGTIKSRIARGIEQLRHIYCQRTAPANAATPDGT